MTETVNVKRCGSCGADHRHAQGDNVGYDCPTTGRRVTYLTRETAIWEAPAPVDYVALCRDETHRYGYHQGFESLATALSALRESAKGCGARIWYTTWDGDVDVLREETCGVDDDLCGNCRGSRDAAIATLTAAPGGQENG